MFTVELAGKSDLYCELDLPAAPYQLLDALDKLQMAPSDNPSWEICEFHDFEYLASLLDGSGSLYELNALSNRLAELDDRASVAFQGLLQMEINKRDGDIQIPRLIDLAYSTDCCHVVGEALNDSQLGRFYAENGFIPEVKAVPDEIFELLDFEMLGRKARMGEHGVFTLHGYVTQHDDLKEIFATLDLSLKDPTYIFRCVLNNYLYDDEDWVWLNMPLDLPATEEVLDAVLEKLGTPDWDSVILGVVDSAVPGILEDTELSIDSMVEINRLAQAIQYRKERDELPKLKAVLHTVDCSDVSTIISIVEDLDDYLYEPTARDFVDVAKEELRLSVDEKTLSILQKHVNLYDYGRDLIAANHAAITPYGLVERRDGQPIQAPAEQPRQGGMEMA
nr:antirestriction protein ArdA [uncultured Oscillibacter sp.]